MKGKDDTYNPRRICNSLLAVEEAELKVREALSELPSSFLWDDVVKIEKGIREYLNVTIAWVLFPEEASNLSPKASKLLSKEASELSSKASKLLSDKGIMCWPGYRWHGRRLDDISDQGAFDISTILEFTEKDCNKKLPEIIKSLSEFHKIDLSRSFFSFLPWFHLLMERTVGDVQFFGFAKWIEENDVPMLVQKEGKPVIAWQIQKKSLPETEKLNLADKGIITIGVSDTGTPQDLLKDFSEQLNQEKLVAWPNQEYTYFPPFEAEIIDERKRAIYMDAFALLVHSIFQAPTKRNNNLYEKYEQHCNDLLGKLKRNPDFEELLRRVDKGIAINRCIDQSSCSLSSYDYWYVFPLDKGHSLPNRGSLAKSQRRILGIVNLFTREPVDSLDIHHLARLFDSCYSHLHVMDMLMTTQVSARGSILHNLPSNLAAHYRSLENYHKEIEQTRSSLDALKLSNPSIAAQIPSLSAMPWPDSLAVSTMFLSTAAAGALLDLLPPQVAELLDKDPVELRDLEKLVERVVWRAALERAISDPKVSKRRDDGKIEGSIWGMEGPYPKPKLKLAAPFTLEQPSRGVYPLLTLALRSAFQHAYIHSLLKEPFERGYVKVSTELGGLSGVKQQIIIWNSGPPAPMRLPRQEGWERDLDCLRAADGRRVTGPWWLQEIEKGIYSRYENEPQGNWKTCIQYIGESRSR
jgi:hypothetical protein